ncbi:MAG: hypothetical protein AAGH68_15850 [Pseudomonadota bacterium]
MDPIGFTSLVMLDEAAEILEGPLQRAFSYVAPKSSLSLTETEAFDSLQAVRCSVDGHEIVCALYEGQMPEAEYDIAAKNSVFWLDADAHVGAHGAYLVMAAAEKETAMGLVRAQAVAMTRLAAALCEALPASGLYWTSGGVFSPPQAVTKATTNIAQGRWPVDVWVGWKIFAHKQSNRRILAIRSRGAADFLGFELQMPPFEASDNKEPMRILVNTAAHLVAHGNIIPDGNTVIVKGERQTRYSVKMGRGGQPGIAELQVIEELPPEY